MQYRMPISTQMENNVDAILQQNHATDASNSSLSVQIDRRPVSSIVSIQCVFYGTNSSTGQDFQITLSNQIQSLDIIQNFDNAYMDEISLRCFLFPVQLLKILDNYRNLKCKISFYPFKLSTGSVYKEDLIYSNDYLVILKDKQLKKRVSKQMLVPDDYSDINSSTLDQAFDNVQFQLIKESEYQLRKKRFNFILTRVTVKQVIQYIANLCDIHYIYMVQPDNTQVYQNFIIPPIMTFPQAMSFIQQRYGVYKKGFSYYYTNAILYVYPAYDTSPSTLQSAHFYSVGQNSYIGNDLYHAFSGSIAHIVITSTPVVKDLVDGGTQMFGNTYIYQHADKIIDKWLDVEQSTSVYGARIGLGDFVMQQNNLSRESFTIDNYGISKDAYTPVFQFDNGNKFKYTSNLFSYMRILIGAQWTAAQPFVIKPGFKIYWHYDGEDQTQRDQSQQAGGCAQYQTRTGTCNTVLYKYIPASGNVDTIRPYTCTATLQLSIQHQSAREPEKKTQETSSGVIDTVKDTFSKVAGLF